MIATKLTLLSFFLFFTKFAAACNVNPCANDAVKNIGDFVECEMCVCDEACGLKRDDTIYQCYIKLDSMFDASCKVQMTDGWIAGFIIIAVFACCCIFGGGGYLIYKMCCQKKGVNPG